MLTANELIELKKLIDAEIKRRCGYGPMQEVGDFEETPKAGGIIKAEQGEKIISPILEVEGISGFTLTVDS